MNMMAPNRPTNFATGSLVRSLCFVRQNGVEDRSMEFHTEDSSTIRERASSIELGLTMYNDDCPPRPTKLGVGTLNMVNKSQGDDEEEGDGSLPCTPEMRSDVDTDTDSQSGGEALESNTKQIISTFLRDYVGSSMPKRKQDNVQTTMTRVVQGVLEKHQYAYKGMIKKLELDGRGEDMSFVTSVAKSTFADGTTNWGRIASLVAFGAALCQYLEATGKKDCVSQVAKEISTYLLSDQQEWLVKNNSWDGFVEFFRVSDPETTVRNTLMAFAGFAGIGATIALLIR